MHIIVAAGGLVVNELNEILFIYRRKHWDLPKGKLDPNESIEECAVREVKEEVGLQNIVLDKFICTSIHKYFDKWIKKKVEKHTHWYIMYANSTEILLPQAEEDIEKIVWVKPNELQNYLEVTFPSIVEVVKTYQKLL